jgi:hypothetical protein
VTVKQRFRYRLFGWMALTVWVTALFMPIQTGELADNRLASGLAALLLGWSEHPAWLANIGFLWIVILLIRQKPPSHRLALWVGFFTASLAMSAFTWDNAIDQFQSAQQFAVDFGLGFYVWVGTNVAAASALIMRAWPRTTEST